MSRPSLRLKSASRGWSAFFLGVSIALIPNRAADLRFVAMTKGMFWEQTNTSAPFQPAGSVFQWRAVAELARPNALISGTVAWPRPSSVSKTLGGASNVWTAAEQFTTRNALNSAAPNGAYTVVVQTLADGRKTNVVTVSSDVYPIPPRIANFVEAQAIDSKADFTLRWDPAGSGANGFTQIRIMDGNLVLFETPAYPQAVGALNGSAGSVLIPKNTFAEGRLYHGEITIWRKVMEDTKGYPGVPAWGAYTQTTRFPLRTRFNVTDAHWYGFAKTQRYLQTGASAPVLDGTAPFEFIAFADATAAANISLASVSTASGAAALLNTAGSWRITESFATQQALDARFPPGTLNMLLHTAHNGVHTVPLPLPNGAYPAAPQISNFNEANAFDPAQPFSLRWNPLAGGTADDFVQVRLFKGGAPVLQSGACPGASGALNGTSTSFTVPANFLGPGETGEARILFLKAAVLDRFSYPQVLGFSGYGRETTASLRARGGAVSAPAMSARKNGGKFQFEFPAEQGRQYIVQGSTDLTNWTSLLITNAPGGNVLLEVNIDPGQRRQLFRLFTQ